MDEPSAPLVAVVILFYDIDRLLYFRKERLSGFPHSKRMLSSDLFPWSWVWKHCFCQRTGYSDMDDVVCQQNDEVSLLCMQLPFGTGEKVLDMGLQMSGVYQVWHHDIFCYEKRRRVGSTSLCSPMWPHQPGHLSWEIGVRDFLKREEIVGLTFFINIALQLQVACDVLTTLSCQIEEYQWNWRTRPCLLSKLDSQSLHLEVYYRWCVLSWANISLSPLFTFSEAIKVGTYNA